MEDRFCDILLCKKCGELVERGIVNLSNHYAKCGSMDFEDVFDAECEVIEPKQLPETKNQQP